MGVAPHLVLGSRTYCLRMAVPHPLVKTMGRAGASTSCKLLTEKKPG